MNLNWCIYFPLIKKVSLNFFRSSNNNVIAEIPINYTWNKKSNLLIRNYYYQRNYIIIYHTLRAYYAITKYIFCKNSCDFSIRFYPKNNFLNNSRFPVRIKKLIRVVHWWSKSGTRLIRVEDMVLVCTGA